jgi:TRAP-type C4-dicarboxylate transport system permease small subunit
MLGTARATFLAIERVTTRLATWSACAALALAVSLTCYQIVMRYIVRQSTAWSEPILQMAIIYMVYLGAAAAFRSGALVAIDLLLTLARGRARAALSLFIVACCVVLLGHMVWYGWEMTLRAQFNVNPTLGISMSWAFAAVPIGGAFALLAVIAHLLDPPPRLIDSGG